MQVCFGMTKRHTFAPEPTGLCLDDSKRPDGITLFSWKHGMQLVWDVTCPGTLAPSYLHLTSKEAGKAAEKAEKEKIQKYQELTHKYIVMPVAVETMGAWGHSSLKFVQEIGERMKMASGDKQATFKLLQNISMEVQTGNIASILEHFHHPNLLINYSTYKFYEFRLYRNN